MTGSQEIPLPAWNLLLSQRQEFLDNHFAQVLITPNQQGTFEMREDSLAIAGAQDMDASGYELSDLEHIEFFWEKNPQVELDGVCRPGIDRINTPFSATAFNDLEEMGEGGSSKNPIVLVEEEDKENSSPTTPVSERPTEPPRLLKSRPFRGRIENVKEFVYRILLE